MKRHSKYLAAVLALMLPAALAGSLHDWDGTPSEVLTALDAYERAQADLERDAIKLRGGLLHNDDPLVADTRELEAASRSLGASAKRYPAMKGEVAALAAAAAAQTSMTERLKSDSALINNSLTYFSRLTTPSADEPFPPSEISALGAAMLRLTVDASRENQSEVASRIEAVAREDGPSAVNVAVLSHASLLERLLPATHQDVDTLLANDAGAERRSLRIAVLRALDFQRLKGTIVRIGLSLISIALAAMLLDLGLRLRNHVRALRRRAELERLVVEISATLIRAQRHEVRSAVVGGLGRLGFAVGADRAYLITAGRLGLDYRWARDGVRYPAGWPWLALDLAAEFPGGARGAFHIAEAQAPVCMKLAGARSAAAVWATCEEGSRLMLGLDAQDTELRLTKDELEIVRLALDVFAGAVRRWDLEYDRAELEQRLQEVSRMEAIGAFASGIAHNFNNLLAAIGGYGEMATGDVSKRSRAARRLGEIQSAVARGRDLIDRILAFGRGSTAPRQELDLKMTLEEARSLLRAAHACASIEVAAEGAGVVTADPGALQQILLNLGANAIQASSGAAQVRLTASPQRVSRPRSLVCGHVAPGDYVVVEVEDRGRGVDPRLLQRIFDPFFTTRSDGHGLGLATVGALVRDHGGAIDVISTAGQGSRFQVWLPRTLPADMRGSAPIAHGQGEALLLLSDTDEGFCCPEERFAELGYEPVSFTDVSAALVALAATPERFDGAIIMAAGDFDPRPWVAALQDAAPRLPLMVTSPACEKRSLGAPDVEGATSLAWPIDARSLADVLRGL